MDFWKRKKMVLLGAAVVGCLGVGVAVAAHLDRSHASRASRRTQVESRLVLDSHSPRVAAMRGRAARDSQYTREGTSGNGEEPNWDQPFVDGVQVPGVSAAPVSFRPVVPAAVDGLQSVVVHRSFRPQAIGLVYQSPTHGRFLALEMPAANMSELDLATLARSCHPERGCEGRWEMVPLVDGKNALLISNPPVTNGLLWVQNGVLFDVYGPGDTLTVDEASQLARSFATAK